MYDLIYATLPRRDKLYFRACPRCGGTIRYRRVSDTECELACLVCGRNYENRRPTIVNELAHELKRDLREVQVYRPTDRETRRREIFGVIRSNPDITPWKLSKKLGTSFTTGRYWIRRYQAIGSRYDPPSEIAG